MLEKTYDAKAVEPKIAKIWEEADAFRAGAGAEEGAEPFTIVIPPPNVTGSLHMGHALNNTLQDILVRFERMRGKNVLWQPGMDHAGIATQMVVERQLMERQIRPPRPGPRGIRREGLGVEGRIRRHDLNQLKRLGASCDWSRERFTMDEGLSRGRARSVRHALQGRPDLQGQAAGELGPEAADRDLRPRGRAAGGQRQSLAPPLSARGPRPSIRKIPKTFITVATTRPETMLGDTGVAVHPDDERYRRSGRQERRPAARRPQDPDRRRRVFRPGKGHRARSRSRRRTTSTTSRSASATSCRRSTS